MWANALGKRKKMKTDTGPQGSWTGQWLPVQWQCVLKPSARKQKVRRGMTHLETKRQSMIRWRNKGDVNQGNMLEKAWLWGHCGRPRGILAVIQGTRMNELCEMLSDWGYPLFWWEKKKSSRKNKVCQSFEVVPLVDQLTYSLETKWPLKRPWSKEPKAISLSL